MRRPADVGLPADKFPEWRKGQDRALRDLMFSRDRYNLLCIPTGGGKTAIGMGYIGVDDGRAAYLTATKALQDQVEEFFHSMGLVDVRGRSNYTCDIDHRLTAAEAICTGGIYCALMKGGCRYYDTVKEARDSRITLTNYSFWLNDEEAGKLGEYATVILDEAHAAPDQISNYAAVEVTEGELKKFGIPWPGTERNLQRWAALATHMIDERMGEVRGFSERKKARELARKLGRLGRLSDQEWLGSRPRRSTWRWDLIDPGALAEELLFRGARKVILVSASVRRKTLKLLGVDQRIKVIEQESTFPVARRPVYYWPVAQVNWRMSSTQKQSWVESMDEIMEQRDDRRGLIHSHSFDWGKTIAGLSNNRRNILLHEKGTDAADILKDFKRSRVRGLVLVSPSFSTGTDFPYTDAEYQIIPKVPFPDFKAPLVKARIARDKEYVPYVTMQTITQATGRVMRAVDDQGETFILDQNFGWLRNAHWDFAPRYFHAAIRTIGAKDAPPPPPPPLRRSR